MKFALLVFGLIGSSSSAFGYTHFASGNGFACSALVAVRVKDHSGCRAHVKSESKPDPVRRMDPKSRPYTSVTQIIDNADCLESSFYVNIPDILGDTASPISAELVGTVGSSGTNVKYNNDRGQIDMENRHGVDYFVTKEADPAAAQRDQAKLLAAFHAAYPAIHVDYNPTAQTLTFSIAGSAGVRTVVQPAIFAKGTSSHVIGFRASLDEPFAFASSLREATIELNCSPLTH